MGVEDEIRTLLVRGLTPIDLITQYHFKKSTVYKVYNSMKMSEIDITPSKWVVEDINFNKNRYLPGEHVSVSYRLKNLCPLDLYTYRVGVEPEWLRQGQKWYVHGNRFLLRQNESQLFRGDFDMPANLPLGEYDLCFGVEGHYISPASIGEVTTNQTMWANPVTIDVKYPLSGKSVFISHSTIDMSLVRSLANYLDNHGIVPIIAEEVSSPGSYLPDKIEKEIRECDIFLALLTYEAAQSKWVQYETDLAFTLNKPRITLKDESIKIDTLYEWTPFSKYEPIHVIAGRVLSAIDNLSNSLAQPIKLPLGGILLVGILGFIAGLAFASTSNQPSSTV